MKLLLTLLIFSLNSCAVELFLEWDEENDSKCTKEQRELLYLEKEYRISGKEDGLDQENFFSEQASSGAIFEEDGNLYVIFFGSDDPLDIYYNMAISLTSTSFLPKSMKVQSGMINNYTVIRDLVLESVDAYLNSEQTGKIYLLGHSAGGCSAYYAAADLLANRNCTDRVFCLTGASPKPGNKDFSEYLESSGMEIHRYINGSDMVPSLPPADLGFSHVGDLHKIGPEPNVFMSSTLLWTTQHFIQHYCESLDKGQY